MKFLNKFRQSSKLSKDIDFIYNSIDNLKPISIQYISLIAPIKKNILNFRDKNKNIIIEKKNKKMSLIVPYRHRKEHLDKFLPYINSYLKKQNIEYEIIVVEQLDNKSFNKAKLMNIGALNSSKDSDYFVFHDVDLLPENIDYNYTNHTQKLFTYIKENNEYKKYGEMIFGGAILIPINIFFDINGFSNQYWQWGKEDDDFFMRNLIKGYVPLINTEGKFIALPHEPSLNRASDGSYVKNKVILKENKKLYQSNRKYFSNFKRGFINQNNDGYSTLKNYKIKSIIEQNFVKTIAVEFV